MGLNVLEQCIIRTDHCQDYIDAPELGSHHSFGSRAHRCRSRCTQKVVRCTGFRRSSQLFVNQDRNFLALVLCLWIERIVHPRNRIPVRRERRGTDANCRAWSHIQGGDLRLLR